MYLSHTAMIRALKALQDKIRALELEKAAAAEKFRHLGQQADQHKQQQKHSVRQQLNKSSQYNTPPSDTSTDGECSYWGSMNSEFWHTLFSIQILLGISK